MIPRLNIRTDYLARSGDSTNGCISATDESAGSSSSPIKLSGTRDNSAISTSVAIWSYVFIVLVVVEALTSLMST